VYTCKNNRTGSVYRNRNTTLLTEKGEVETECAGGGFMFVRLYEADVTMINRDPTWATRIELAN